MNDLRNRHGFFRRFLAPRPNFGMQCKRKSDEEIRAGTIVPRIRFALKCTPMGRMASDGPLAYFKTLALADESDYVLRGYHELRSEPSRLSLRERVCFRGVKDDTQTPRASTQLRKER
jgi:hypothetical protein